MKGLVRWPVYDPETLSIVTTLYRHTRSESFEPKEWTFLLEEVSPSFALPFVPLASRSGPEGDAEGAAEGPGRCHAQPPPLYGPRGPHDDGVEAQDAPTQRRRPQRRPPPPPHLHRPPHRRRQVNSPVYASGGSDEGLCLVTTT